MFHSNLSMKESKTRIIIQTKSSRINSKNNFLRQLRSIIWLAQRNWGNLKIEHNYLYKFTHATSQKTFLNPTFFKLQPQKRPLRTKNSGNDLKPIQRFMKGLEVDINTK